MSALLSFPSSAPQLRVVSDSTSSAVVTIRGVRLQVDELVDRSLFTKEGCQRLHERLMAAVPFPHVVIENLFHPALLDLVLEEFDIGADGNWCDVQSKYESTRRSTLGANLGPASQLYFDTISSGWFTAWLSDVTGTPYLLPDPLRFGGGLHESQTGGTFAVHRDFNLHPHIGLKNEMVFITYLNRGWQREWGSTLELWDARKENCITRVMPEFGHTLLMPHGPASFHGHPEPLNAPDGRPRRSVAAYYYTSPRAGKNGMEESISIFMKPRRIDRAKAAIRAVTPPIAWNLARKMSGR